MARQHGITENTYKKMVFDAGKVYKNFTSIANPGTLLGATRGGSSLSIETEYKDIAVDGAKGPVKGGRRITRCTAKLTVNFIEITNQIIEHAIPGADEYSTTYSPDHITLRRSLELAAADYLDSVVLLVEMSGSDDPLGCGIENALCDGNFELSFADNEESGLTVTFTGHFTPSELDLEPWFLLYPTELTTTVAP